MNPETIDTVITLGMTVGLVLAGAGALAALPWRRAELEAAHRAGGAVGRVALTVAARSWVGAAVPARERVVTAVAVSR